MLDRPAPTTRNRVAALVQTILLRHAGHEAVTDDARLVDAGMTSVDMVNLMLAVEAEFDVMIPPTDITTANFRSIATIEAMMDRILADQA